MIDSVKAYCLLAIFLFLCLFQTKAQMPFEEWVNLARTNLATASVSSVNGDRSALNRYYGAANLFDGGSNPIQHINYDYWLSDAMPNPHWVELAFEKAVEIHALKIEVRERLRPLSFQMLVVKEEDASSQEELLGPILIAEKSAYYALPQPLGQVRKIRLLFEGTGEVSVAEIELLGKTEAAFQKTDGPHIEDDGKLRPEAGPPPAEIDSVLNRYFRAISGQGAHSWRALHALCEADVQFLVMGIDKKGENVYHRMSLKQYKKHIGAYMEQNGFFQIDFNRRTQFYYRIAQVWSEFESRNMPDGPAIDRGRISFQLVEKRGEWKIASVMWNSKPEVIEKMRK